MAYKQVDVDIELEDVEEFLYTASPRELDEIQRILNEKRGSIDASELRTVADELKYKFLMELYDRYTLEELEQKFK